MDPISIVYSGVETSTAPRGGIKGQIVWSRSLPNRTMVPLSGRTVDMCRIGDIT